MMKRRARFASPSSGGLWLAGLDVPNLAMPDPGKPPDAHTLMQVIAHANRVHEGKNNGLIVAYCGVPKHLRQTLTTFVGPQPEGGGGPWVAAMRLL